MFFFFIFTYHHSIRYLALSIHGLFTWHCYSIANFVSEASSSIPQRVSGTNTSLQLWYDTFGEWHCGDIRGWLYLQTCTIIQAMLHKEEQLGMRYLYVVVTLHRDFQRTAALVMLSGFTFLCRLSLPKALCRHILTYYLCGLVSVLVGWLLTECIPMPSIFASDSTTELASVSVLVSNKWSSVGGGTS